MGRIKGVREGKGSTRAGGCGSESEQQCSAVDLDNMEMRPLLGLLL